MIINISEILFSLLMTSWTSTKQLKTKMKSKLTGRVIVWVLLMIFFHSKGVKTASLESVDESRCFRITGHNFVVGFFLLLLVSSGNSKILSGWLILEHLSLKLSHMFTTREVFLWNACFSNLFRQLLCCLFHNESIFKDAIVLGTFCLAFFLISCESLKALSEAAFCTLKREWVWNSFQLVEYVMHSCT